MAAAEHRVAHRAADEVELVAGVGERGAEPVEHRREPVELHRDPSLHLHHREGVAVGHGAESTEDVSPYPRGMVGARAMLRALVAAVVPALLVPLAGPGVASGPAHAATPARAPAAERTPLEVTIDAFTPSVLPLQGTITIRGTVTNVSDDTWSTINLYAILGDDRPPMRTADELAAALEVPPDTDVGPRITDAGRPGRVDELVAGDSASFTVVLPVSAVQVTTPGVYWFGVHAVGESPSSPRDDLADGRARTFLPYVPPRFDEPVAAAVVLPVARGISYRSDGAVSDVDKWEELLGPRGRLGRVPQVAAAADGVPFTLALDPALFDTLDQLARGNPARSLGPTVTPADPDAPPTDDPSGTPGDDETEPELSEENLGTQETPEELGADPGTPSARAAAAWLDDLARTLPDSQVMTLPYGNPDLPAMAAHDPNLYELASRPRDGALRGLGVEPDPVVVTPSGYLSAASIAMVDDDTTILVGDRMFRGEAPAAASIDGRRTLVTTTAVTQGTPGPGPSVTALGLRQRFLAEAALRAIDGDDRPVVWSVPREWDLRDPSSLFAGLDLPWLALGTLDEVADDASTTEVQPEELQYPQAQQDSEVGADNFLAVEEMVAAGGRLERVLAENDQIGDLMAQQALTGVSYSVRGIQASGRAGVRQSVVWVAGVLARVRILAPRGVTLSSSSGSFRATVTNQLDQPVTVSVIGRSDAGLEVVPAEPVTLEPRSRTTLLLETRVSTPRVHDVTLLVTDADGEPIGPTDEVAIRSSQVSDVIWVIMGTGAGLLVVAIIVRLVRRVRTARGTRGTAAA